MDKRGNKRRAVTTVQRSFSASALRYDEHAEVQEQIAVHLFSKLPRVKSFTHILDVGMGTGRLTQVLTKKFPDAQVVGLDFAHGMVTQARRRSRAYGVVQADARQLPFRSGKFDLIVSNLAYQWVDDLTGAFREAREALAGGGGFVVTLFGRHSLMELFDSLDAAGAKNFFPRRLPTLAEIEKALKASGLLIREVHSQLMMFEFHGMWDLLVWLKAIGANALPRKGFIGKQILTKANQYYYEHFKTPRGVAVTFEMIWFEAHR